MTWKHHTFDENGNDYYESFGDENPKNPIKNPMGVPPIPSTPELNDRISHLTALCSTFNEHNRLELEEPGLRPLLIFKPDDRKENITILMERFVRTFKDVK